MAILWVYRPRYTTTLAGDPKGALAYTFHFLYLDCLYLMSCVTTVHTMVHNILSLFNETSN